MSEASRRLRTATALLRRLTPRVDAIEDELDAFPDLVTLGSVCLDVGAKHGAYTLAMADAAGTEGRVVAFEPLPGPRRVIRAGRRLLGGRTVDIVAAAVSAVSGTGTIGLPIRRGIPVPGRAFLTSHADGLGSHAGWRHRTIDVKLVSLDDWCEQHAIDRVTAIKVDVEGAEQQVLDGASRLIERDRPALLVELEDRHLGRFGATAQAVFDGLIARGYRASVLHGRRWVERDTASRTLRNHLFVHRDFVHRDAPSGAPA
jgi:FkbM family methyltransferase